MTEAEYNKGKATWLDILTPKFKEQTHVVSNITPMQQKDMGQPPFGTTIDKAVITDTRKIGNPHANDYYTYGKR